MRELALICFGLVGVLGAGLAEGQDFNLGNMNHPLILSTTVHTDSRGELVYEFKGEADADAPVVAGAFVPPSILKLAKPKYPASLKKAKLGAEVLAEGVVSKTGEIIDLKMVETKGTAPDVSEAALGAIRRYKFKAATLDGSAIAFRLKIALNFQIY